MKYFGWIALLTLVVCSPPSENSQRKSKSLSPAIQLHVEVWDQATGQLVPARLYLVDSQGNHWAPEQTIRYDKYQEHHFISLGSFHIQLPPGAYTLTAERGPEYRPSTSLIEVRASPDQKERVVLNRWISMNQLDWYSADLHNHRKPQEMPDLLLAEDLNLAPTLTDWIWEDKPISLPSRTSQAIQLVDATHVYSVLDKEVERLEYGPGAIDLLGLKSTIPFEGNRLYPPSDHFCKLAHDQGGYVDAEKIVWRDVCALVALNQIDFVGIVHNHFNRQGVELETEPWGMIPKGRPEFDTLAGMPLWSMEVYYRFLNCGFQLPVSAGSASGVKPSPLGYNRVYAKPEGPFSYDHWFRALKAGRSFATNGPMLFLQVNGEAPGSTLHLPSHQPGRVKIHAEAASAGNLDRLEILFKGRVIQTTKTLDTSGKLVADFESQIKETGWVAARCFEQPGATLRFAHTSPIYIQFGQQSGVVREDAQFFIDWIDREVAFFKKEKRFRNLQEQAEMLSLFERARVVYVKLKAP